MTRRVATEAKAAHSKAAQGSAETQLPSIGGVSKSKLVDPPVEHSDKENEEAHGHTALPSVTSNAAEDAVEGLPPIAGGTGKAGLMAMGRGKPAGTSNYHNYSLNKNKPAPMGARAQVVAVQVFISWIVLGREGMASGECCKRSRCVPVAGPHHRALLQSKLRLEIWVRTKYEMCSLSIGRDVWSGLVSRFLE